MDGFGVMKYRNGDVYTGQWTNNMRQGAGVMAVWGSYLTWRTFYFFPT
eukprot:gene36678-45247_t